MSSPGAQPVTFIVGPARSGTTLLYKALCLHPRAAWISNWVRRAPSVPQFAVLNRVARVAPARSRAVWFAGDGGSAYVYGRRRQLVDRCYPMPVEGEPLYRRCGIGDDEGDSPSTEQARALGRAFGTLARAGGGDVVVSKRIANNRRIPLLAAALPGARFVSIVRDGRAVAASLARVDWWEDSTVWWYGATPATWRAQGRDPWELCARNWVEEVRAIEAGLARVDARRAYRLTYEELLEAPHDTIARVAAFSGLPACERWSEQLERLRFPDRRDTWRRDLDPGTIDVIESVQREMLAAQGYAG